MKKLLFYALLLISLGAFSAKSSVPPAVVVTQKVKLFAWQPSYQATGKLISNQGITIKSEVSSRVTEITFQSGENVKKGHPLLQMNDQGLQAQKKLITSDLNLSTTNLKRKQDLFAKGALSKSELDTAYALVQSNQAKIEEIDAQLDQRRVIAPFSGKLGLRKISLGDYLSPGQAIVNLQSVDPIFVDFDMPEHLVPQLKVNQKITIHAESIPNKHFSGSIRAFESLISPGSQSLKVRGVIANSKQDLLPGTLVGVKVYLSQPEDVIMIPQTAVVYSLEGSYVYTVNGNIVHKQIVEIQQRTKEAVIVKSGLKVDDTIVTIGNLKLYDGARITSTSPTTLKKQ